MSPGTPARVSIPAALSVVRPITRLRGLGHGLELTPCEGCESLVLLPLGSVTLPSLRQPPYGRVSERVILQNDTESESESESNDSKVFPTATFLRPAIHIQSSCVHKIEGSIGRTKAHRADNDV